MTDSRSGATQGHVDNLAQSLSSREHPQHREPSGRRSSASYGDLPPPHLRGTSKRRRDFKHNYGFSQAPGHHTNKDVSQNNQVMASEEAIPRLKVLQRKKRPKNTEALEFGQEAFAILNP